jgi:hypothetical protein
MVDRRLAADEPLTANQIERLLRGYTRNLLQTRATAIAQTEGLRVTNQARNIAVKQSLEAAGKPIQDGFKTWLHTSAAAPRETHLQMVGDTVGINEAFTTPHGARLMYPGDTSLGAGAREIVNCQCGIEYHVGE